MLLCIHTVSLFYKLVSLFGKNLNLKNFYCLELKPSSKLLLKLSPALIFAYNVGPILKEGSEQYWLTFFGGAGEVSSVEKLEKSWECITYQNSCIKVVKLERGMFPFLLSKLAQCG